MLRHATASLLLGAGAAVAAQVLPAQVLPAQVLPAQVLPAQQSREDAWWTGPMLAANGATLPQGHALIEPYLFNIITRGHFDTNGNKHAGPLEHDLGSLASRITVTADPHLTSRSWCRKRCLPAVTIISRMAAMELAPAPIRPRSASTCNTISACRTGASCAAAWISPTASPPR